MSYKHWPSDKKIQRNIERETVNNRKKGNVCEGLFYMTGVSRRSLRGMRTIAILWFMWPKKNLFSVNACFASLRRLTLQRSFVNIRIETVSTMSLLWGCWVSIVLYMAVSKGVGALDARLCMVVHDSSWFIWKSDLISCGGFAAKKYKKQTEAPSDPDARSQLRKGKKWF